MATLAPMPRARVKTVTRDSQGAPRTARRLNRVSCKSERIMGAREVGGVRRERRCHVSLAATRRNPTRALTDRGLGKLDCHQRVSSPSHSLNQRSRREEGAKSLMARRARRARRGRGEEAMVRLALGHSRLREGFTANSPPDGRESAHGSFQ